MKRSDHEAPYLFVERTNALGVLVAESDDGIDSGADFSVPQLTPKNTLVHDDTTPTR